METQSSSGLEVMSEDGKPVKRVRDAQACRTLVERLIQGGQERSRKWATLRGMLDGNPPYSSAKLRNSGQAYRSNFSSLEGKALLDSAKTPFYELFSGGKTQMWVTIESENSDEDSRIVTEEVDRRLSEWDGFHTQMWKSLDDYVAFGRAHFVWETMTDWKFCHIPFHKVLFPDATDVDTDRWDYFVVRQSVPVHWLWKKIKNEQASTSVGWNRQEVIKSITNAAPQNYWHTQPDFMLVQQELKDNDLYFSANCDVINIANVFVREYSGKWSWYVVDERITNTYTGEQDRRDYLYARYEAFSDIGKWMANFFFDVGDGSINGLSGLAEDVYQFVMIKDRMLNCMADNTFFRGSLILQAADAAALQNASLTLIGNTVIVPPGVNIQNSQVVGDVETSLAVVRDFDARIQNNTGVYKAQVVKPQGNPRTATEAELQFAQSATLTSSATNRFYIQLDLLYKEVYRRMAENDSTFINRCVDRGVKKEAVKKPKMVTAVRTIGGGSPVQRQQSLSALAPFVSAFPEDGKRNFISDLVAAFATQSKVDSYMPKVELPNRDHWDATQENAAIKEGSPVIWTPEQNDSVHAQVHFGAAMQVVQAIESGQIGEPEEALAFLGGVIGHVTTTHLPRLEESRPQEAKMYGQIIQKIMQAIQKLQQFLKEQAKQQQEMQQMNVKQQMEAAQVQHKMQMAEAKTMSGIQLRNVKAATDTERQNTVTESDIRRQNAATAAEIMRQNAKAQAEILAKKNKPSA